MNGNGELTETENVIFLRKLRSSYGILTDERNSYVLLQWTTAIREQRNGYVMMETTNICVVYAWFPALRIRSLVPVSPLSTAKVRKNYEIVE